MTLKDNRAPLLWYFKLCASFRTHWWIQTGVTVRNRPIWVKIDDFFLPRDLEIWRITLKNNRAPLLSNIKLYASFYHHMWIQTVVMVRKQLNGVTTSVTLTFDIWPWSFACTSLLSLVITPENFMMIRWEEHCQKGVTDRRTDRQTETTVLRAAWSQLKMEAENWNDIIYIYIYIYIYIHWWWWLLCKIYYCSAMYIPTAISFCPGITETLAGSALDDQSVKTSIRCKVWK